MEVHHSHSHGKKKWSERLFEFLLLFFAVFLGFVSENIREKVVERHRTKQYIEFLIRDLKTDTANINSLCLGNDTLINIFDSLIVKLRDFKNGQDARSLYYFDTWSHQFFTFTHTSRAIDQLLNAGQLRLIDDVNLTDSISAYYENVKGLEDYGKLYMDYSKIWHQLEYRIFDYSQINTSQSVTNFDPKRKYTLITDDPKLIIELINQILHARDMLYVYIDYLRYIQGIATSTLKYVQKG